MKKLLVLLFVTSFIGCGIERDKNGSILLNEKGSEMHENPRLEVIDSCEYLVWGHGLAHKGDCKFCKERRKQEFYEMIDVLFNTESYDSISKKND